MELREDAVRNGPVGVFDSGAGGLSVLAEMVRTLPNEDFLFYGDQKNAPYGTKSPEAVRRLAEEAAEKLTAMGAKALVIACNTATARAAGSLRAKYDFPIIGMEPAIKPASLLRHGGVVLAMATPSTLASEKYAVLSEKYGEGVIPLPCPGLMEYVERGMLRGDEVEGYLRRLFAPFAGEQVDAVVLGCTHYVFLRGTIRACFPPETAIVDGNAGTARQLKRRLAETGMLRQSTAPGKVTILTSLGGEGGDKLRMLWEKAQTLRSGTDEQTET